MVLLSTGYARDDTSPYPPKLTEDRRSYELNEPLAEEDRSCSAVNRPLQRGYNSSRYAVQEWEVWPDGHTTLAFEQRSNGRYMYIFDTVMGWSIRQRWELYTVEDGRPVFTSCKPAIVSTYRGVPAMYIEADWRRRNLHALATTASAGALASPRGPLRAAPIS